jgi:3-hydroxybutyryl-CoA dehydrogenase
MGAGIAQVALEAGDDVAVFDIAPGAMDRARARITDGLARRAAKLDDGARDGWVDECLARLRPVGRLEDLATGSTIVVEAAVEDLALKRVVFAMLDAAAAPDVLLATNTSALSVAAIAGDATDRERIVGLHFFNPAPVMPLVEVVAGPDTSADTLDRAEAAVVGWGKTPIRCVDSPGFVVNRVNRPFTLEPLRLLEGGGATIEEIDAAVRAEGFPQGPFEHIDLIGLDVNLARRGRSTRPRAPGAPGAVRPPGAAGRRPPARPQERRRLLEYDGAGRRVRAGQGSAGGRPARAAAAGLARRRVRPPIAEAYFALGDGVATAERIDAALRLGAAHPQGPIEWARARGEATVRDALLALAATEGERFAPAPALAAE